MNPPPCLGIIDYNCNGGVIVTLPVFGSTYVVSVPSSLFPSKGVAPLSSSSMK
jgi:hypothetical protein